MSFTTFSYEPRVAGLVAQRGQTSATPRFHRLRIAAIVPCHNEEAAVGKVVADLRAAVPSMDVYVYDNRSTDRTVERATQAGAIVRHEHSKGKGNVVRRAFADIDADIYVLIDGDDTYDTADLPAMIETLVHGPYDHVLGVRRPERTATSAYRPNHELGNRLLNKVVGYVFGTDMGDMLSGYRVFSRRFVKSFPAVSREFEIETELTVHSIGLRAPTVSMPVGFRDRAAGSESKLRTYRDGFKILRLIGDLARHERPLAFFGLLAMVFLTVGGGLSLIPVVEYVQTGLVYRFPSLITGVALLGMGTIAFAAGLILDGSRKTRHELSRLAYLRYPAITEEPGTPCRHS